MILIEPEVELWSEEGVTPEQHIARCARICYGHDGTGKNPKELVEGLIKSKHLSMLRHASKYYLFKDAPSNDTASYLSVCPYNHEFRINSTDFYLSTNLQENSYSNNFNYVGYEHELSISELLEECKKTPKLFGIVRLTFCLTTQISTSRELNRVSPNNIAERSTRYCSSKNGLEICKPWWWNEDHAQVIAFEPAYLEQEAHLAWTDAEEHYQRLLNLGMKPEDARGVLPLDTATKVVYTYSVAEWRHILGLRYYGKTGRPHLNCKLIMVMVRDKINQFTKEHNINYTL